MLHSPLNVKNTHTHKINTDDFSVTGNYKQCISLVPRFVHLFLTHAHWLCYVIMALQYRNLFYILMPYGEMMDQCIMSVCMHMFVRKIFQ